MGKPLSKSNVQAGANSQAFLNNLDAVLTQLRETNEPATFPAPIGTVAKSARFPDQTGAPNYGIVIENTLGELFTASFMGVWSGPVRGIRGTATPSFDEIEAKGLGLFGGANRRNFARPSTGLPAGTLPGGIEWSAPAEGEEQSRPDGTIGLPGESSGINPLTWIVGAAALYFLSQ